jgi:Flp pilus assembly protein TadD
LGELTLAEKCYRDALQHEPKNSHFIGGLASFLYLHGDTDKAFASYLTLLEIERTSRNQRGIEMATTALQVLGRKMGLSETTLAEKLSIKQKIDQD